MFLVHDSSMPQKVVATKRAVGASWGVLAPRSNGKFVYDVVVLVFLLVDVALISHGTSLL